MQKIGIASIALLTLVSWSCYRGAASGSGDAADTDVDSDSDGDADSDSDSDSGSDSDGGIADPACVMEVGGECAGLVAGCAACAGGWIVHFSVAGCDDDEWCCAPYDPPENQCETGGGVCVPSTLDALCPPGWAVSNAICDGDDDECCMPGDGCV
jgi:hypothetical protein